MRLPSLSIALLTLASACSAVAPRCDARDWLSLTEESHLATLSEIKPRFFVIVEIDTLPESVRTQLGEWIDGQIAKLREQMRSGDELWYFNEKKCPNCHSYREGYALIRGCRVVDEITLSDAD